MDVLEEAGVNYPPPAYFAARLILSKASCVPHRELDQQPRLCIQSESARLTNGWTAKIVTTPF